MTVRIEKPSLNLREELAKGTDNTLDKAVWGDLTVNGNISSTGIDDNATATAVTVDASGNVGIGTDSPTFVNGGGLHVHNSAAGRIHVTGGSSGTADTDGLSLTHIDSFSYLWNYENGSMVFGANNAERMRIDSSGHLIAPNGITLGTAVGTYSAANTLDDYEEGTHVATIAPTTSGTITLNSTNNVLAYTKVGRVVHITGDLVIGSVSSPVGTSVEISLPFAINNTTGLSGRIGGAFRYYDASVGDSTITFRGFEGDSVVKATINSSTLASSDSITVSFTYYTTA